MRVVRGGSERGGRERERDNDSGGTETTHDVLREVPIVVAGKLRASFDCGDETAVSEDVGFSGEERQK